MALKLLMNYGKNKNNKAVKKRAEQENISMQHALLREKMNAAQSEVARIATIASTSPLSIAESLKKQQSITNIAV